MKSIVVVSWTGRDKARNDWLCPANIAATMSKGAWKWGIKDIKVREYKPRKKVCRCGRSILQAYYRSMGYSTAPIAAGR